MISDAIARRIADLERHSPPLTSREDLELYWDDALKTSASHPLHASRTRVETPFVDMVVYKVAYHGFDNTPIYGWYLLPRRQAESGEQLPCVVLLHGYTGSRGYPEDYAAYLLMGVAVFAIDIRGQNGETGNLLAQDHGMAKGWITQGILHRDTCYYKAITIDTLKAIDWASVQPEIDPARICVQGCSQGGGLALMAAALSDKPAIAVAHIPNMCQMDFGMLHSNSSLTEAAVFCERFPEHLDTVLETLSYYDIMNLAHKIRIPVFVSAGLKDLTTMPETIYASYNRIASDKRIVPSPFSGHTVTGDQNRKAMQFIAERLVRN